MARTWGYPMAYFGGKRYTTLFGLQFINNNNNNLK